mmetsp:Transcript_44109/g.122130  ORF Transcript_44109/g.122130 Transcript_44109/m.122130 type:complete len:245 (+) Transcript_44109:252-986(+)
MTPRCRTLRSAFAAFISNIASPITTTFATASGSNSASSSRNVFTFHWFASNGCLAACNSRAEMTRMRSNTGRTLGMYRFALCSTHPPSAFVTMTVCPSRRASSNRALVASATAFNCGDVDCTQGRCMSTELQSSVSSQSKIIKVWCEGGRTAGGFQMPPARSECKKDARKSPRVVPIVSTTCRQSSGGGGGASDSRSMVSSTSVQAHGASGISASKMFSSDRKIPSGASQVGSVKATTTQSPKC